ncbi:MAG TPA: phosphate ABC transporter permease PstA [Thermobifida alba]|uniref:phosphate ABC transporter permease PstA n=1 Tax=Thermobifida cellulosilytica TaxID=144786 RepID=UPI0008384C6A|nr:phosphate ABC transporter permease PstA [Thermobifida cellulosilytica]HLU99224.1 phosphate ABC transporter permease PstA [Thermobifida alba]
MTVTNSRTAAPAAPATVLPRRSPAPEAPEVRRSLGRLQAGDVWSLFGAAAAGLSLTGLLYTQLTPFSGVIGFVLLSYLLFLVCYTLLLAQTNDGPAVRDRLAAAVVHSIAGLLLLALAFVVAFTFVRGWTALTNLGFFTRDMSGVGPLQPLEEGGILHAVVGTLIQIGIALAVTIPLGVTCAVFLTEVPGAFSRFVRTVVEAMTALPSIVAGLFIYATVILILGFDLSGFAASLAITVMMLPIVIRAADVVIRLVPGNLREASLALGASQWRTVLHVVLPTSRSGLATAIILGTARGIGETSPVMLTAGVTTALNLNPMSNSMISLPLAVFEFVKSPEPVMITRGFGTALVLLILVILLFAAARVLGGRGPGQLTRRQEHRRVRQSQRDVRRMTAAREARARAAAAAPPDAPTSIVPGL